MQSFSAVFIAALAGAISVSAAPVASLGAPTGEHSVAATLADDGSGVATELTIREQLRPPSGLPTSSSPVGLPEVMDFAAWKAEFGKRYGSHAEELRRASIFAENVALIERHNGDRTKSFRLGVNQFSDLTRAEFKQQALMAEPFPTKPDHRRNVRRLQVEAAPPGPPPAKINCNPTITNPPELCPGNIPCPHCGKEACPCPGSPPLPPSPQPPVPPAPPTPPAPTPPTPPAPTPPAPTPPAPTPPTPPAPAPPTPTPPAPTPPTPPAPTPPTPTPPAPTPPTPPAPTPPAPPGPLPPAPPFPPGPPAPPTPPTPAPPAPPGPLPPAPPFPPGPPAPPTPPTPTPPTPSHGNGTNHTHPLPPAPAGATIDWRTKGAVTPVKNQGHCGACWAFATTGSIEGAYQIATGTLRSLSEQQLMDCSHPEGNNGCKGGIMEKAYTYVMLNGGIDSEPDYNYTGAQGMCWAAAAQRKVATIFNFTDVVSADESQLAAAVMIGPVAVAIEADHPYFQHYKSGVLNDPTACGQKLDHGVLVVGMTASSWIVKNSWGPGWGDQGYVQLAKGVGSSRGMCGIASQPTFPMVHKGSALPVPSPTPGPKPAPPPPPTSGNYGDPYTGPCLSDEKQVTITGVAGSMCCPVCSSAEPCPSDVPPGTTAKPQCILGAPGQPPSYCALVCKSNDKETQTTKLDDLMCPPKASCKPIQTTAICTYDKGSGPTPPPGPPPAPGHGHYEDPLATHNKCQPGEKSITITGLKGQFCSPTCSTTQSCPTDVPPGTTAKGQCILKMSGGTTATQCALVCKSLDAIRNITKLDDLACPAKASCKAISSTAICTYDS